MRSIFWYPFEVSLHIALKKNISFFYPSIQERAFDNSSNINLIISKNICDSRLALPHDLAYLSNIKTETLNKFLNIIKQDYTLKKDPLSNPIKSKSFSKKQQDIFLIREKQKDYINFYNKKKYKKTKKEWNSINASPD